jgi:hypothetical protein
MMKYLIVDASLHGSGGIRDEYEGGYLTPASLGISSELAEVIHVWLERYESEHYNGFSNSDIVDQLDREGKAIASRIVKELSDVKVSYYSDARMTKDTLSD